MELRPNVSHYNRLNPEPIEVTNDFKLNGNLYAVVKYLSRAGWKDLESKDVGKAIDYLNFEIHYKTQPINPIAGSNTEVGTLWTDCVYRDEIIHVLEYARTPSLRGTLPLLVTVLKKKQDNLLKDGR